MHYAINDFILVYFKYVFKINIQGPLRVNKNDNSENRDLFILSSPLLFFKKIEIRI